MSNKYGMIAAAEGFNVLNPGLDQRNINFDSREEHFQFYKTGKVSFTSTTTQSISHGLSYEPGFIAYIKESGDNYWHSIFFNSGDHEAYVDSSNLYLFGENGDEIRYYLFNHPVDPNDDTDVIIQDNVGLLSVVPGANINKPKRKEINFNSNWGSLIIFKTIDLSVSVPSTGTYTNSTAHGMGYTPAYIASVSDGTNSYTEPYIVPGAFSNIGLFVRMDSTNVTAEASGSGVFVPMTAKFKIHILTEELD